MGKYKGGKVTLECVVCDNSFDVYPYRLKQGAKYCSHDCYSETLKELTREKHHNWTREKVVCDKCGKDFEVPKCRVEEGQRFCSRKCAESTQFQQGENIGEDNNRWNDGKTQDHYGYIWATAFDHPYNNKGRYVREHRLVMEEAIGRYLKPEESVHHINFDKSDNRIENLMLFPTESDHQKYHQSLKKVQ